MRLLRVELTRLRWRRAVVVLLAGCLLLPAVLWAGLAWNTRPFSEADVREAQAQLDQELAQPYIDREIRRCTRNPQDYGLQDAPDVEEACGVALGPQLDWFLYRPQLDVAEQERGTGLGVVTVLVALVLLLGTTFAGHDWNSGSMSNQLLFEPRRLRLWVAKAAAVLLTGLVVGALVLAAFWAGVWLLAESRDVQGTAAAWASIRGSVLRAVPLVALAGVGGYALTMFFRSTVATLGVMFAVTVAGNLLVAALLGDGSSRWLLPVNVAAYLFDGVEYYDPGRCTNPVVECDPTSMLSLTAGGTYLLVLLVAAVVLSVWSFRRRDVP
ncbi:ABC transporter permease subunit [Nocardioides donggukensis]|uniref:ABC transporter permease subunit n=1 Tax=Nocardioides donggukensis TaxID=2774019 RepID=A0A927K4C2_9ACTN|nr:ABC transporter permease subunit [Nocardioides donggukensis]MBD8869872.1 ABC transporter permease subunit [Nocardioides donggukensis]